MPKRKITIIIVFFCIVKLTLHLIADSNSGFQGDELLHIETGNYPSFGYMEFPPVIGWLAFIQNQFHSQSVFVHHIFSHIASLLILIFIALTTVELGGKSKAVFIVLLCILTAPAFGRGHQLFQPVAFTHLFWLLSFYQSVRFIKTLDKKYLLYLTICVGFGFLTKYDILFFIAGLSGLLLIKRTRTSILQKDIWKNIFLFILIIAPNVLWQYKHGFPVLDMFSRLYETQLNELTILGVLESIIISLNLVTLIFWVGGLIYMVTTKDNFSYRPIALTILISIALLALNKSKAYYFYPAMITLMMFGSIWFEQKILSKRQWILYPATTLLVLSGMVLIPFGLAVLPLDTFIKFAGIEKKDNRYEIEYKEYYSKSKWEKTMDGLQTVYDSLPPNDKKDCIIWGKHYSQAGGVNLFRENYNLPEAISYHGSFYLWTPERGELPKTIIAFSNGEAGIDFFQSFFNSVVAVKRIYNPYADDEKDLWQTIYICKKPKLNFEQLRSEFKTRIFE
ncbi:glycosyltransferase family 39 protein [Aequorivita sp. SDUM287046]|uniref:Glycosyltransferase family 39 protein n=1 Tax=Aequorivita aurantiaca TaxID=3053356 RepID=A0ABT8DEI4_9FLAO|nr:glycosyltransferase family 39 protein [Aequorivita aurantiaca]MDN3723722.1 glycosyltransferase family 39 protein [Aequorivita aurantiaca]